MVYFCLSWPITLSTCILTDDNSRLQSTSCFFNCFFPLVKGGILTSAKTILTLSLHVKPLSAYTTSPVEMYPINTVMSAAISYQEGDVP